MTAAGQAVAQWNLVPASGDEFRPGHGGQPTAPTNPPRSTAGPRCGSTAADDQLVLASAVSTPKCVPRQPSELPRRRSPECSATAVPATRGFAIPTHDAHNVNTSADANDFTFAQHQWYVNGGLNAAFTAEHASRAERRPRDRRTPPPTTTTSWAAISPAANGPATSAKCSSTPRP